MVSWVDKERCVLLKENLYYRDGTLHKQRTAKDYQNVDGVWIARHIVMNNVTVRGAGPLRQRCRRVVAGRVLLVGDAAGYVDALTGEGIAISLAAADELANCLVADRPLDYNLAWRKASRRYRLLTHTLVQARRLPVVPRTITPLAGRMPWLFAAAVDQLAR